MDTIDRLMIGMERRMTKLLSIFSREHLRVQISRGGNSFTNLTKKVIRIAVYPFDECLPPEQLANAIKFLGYHEASHRRWTDLSQSNILHDEAFDLLKPLMGDKQSTMDFAHDILNSIEDGRIENALVSEYEGLKSLRDWYRLRYREISPASKFIIGKSDVFMRRDIPSEFSSCAMIIKDDSGSMGWSGKEKNAIGALAEIEEIFKGLIPLKIETFSTMEGNLSKVIKDWNDDDMTRNYAESYSRYNFPNGGNNDDFAILAASMQLLKRPEKNKLLIVIGDGEIPCPENVKKVIHWSRKQGIFIVFVFISEKPPFKVSHLIAYLL